MREGRLAGSSAGLKDPDRPGHACPPLELRAGGARGPLEGAGQAGGAEALLGKATENA